MWDWLTPFTLFCGFGLTVAYALLGASWLVMKSENPLQNIMRRISRLLLLALLMIIAVISLWTPLSQPAIAERWFSLPNLFYLLPVPLLVIAISVWLWRTLGQRDAHALPFVLTLGLVFLGFSGLGISIWPNIIPPGISLWQAAAPPQKSGLYAGWRVTDYSRHSWVYLLELLRFPRQSSNWRGISLMEHSWIKRLLWLAAIWGASVLALGAVSMIFPPADERRRASCLI